MININFGEWSGINMQNPDAMGNNIFADFAGGLDYDTGWLDEGRFDIWAAGAEAVIITHGDFTISDNFPLWTSIVDSIEVQNVEDVASGGANFRVLVFGFSETLEDLVDILNTDVTALFEGQGLTIFGSEGFGDTLVGGAQGDLIAGFGGNDKLLGGSGVDLLFGGAGRDTLTGGGGADVFNFGEIAVRTTNADQIRDFKHLLDDISLDNAKFTKLGAAGALANFKFFKSTGVDATGAGAADDRILYDTDSGKLYYDADGSLTVKAPILFATLYNSPDALSAADFMVV